MAISHYDVSMGYISSYISPVILKVSRHLLTSKLEQIFQQIYQTMLVYKPEHLPNL